MTVTRNANTNPSYTDCSGVIYHYMYVKPEANAVPDKVIAERSHAQNTDTLQLH